MSSITTVDASLSHTVAGMALDNVTDAHLNATQLLISGDDKPPSFADAVLPAADTHEDGQSTRHMANGMAPPALIQRRQSDIQDEEVSTFMLEGQLGIENGVTCGNPAFATPHDVEQSLPTQAAEVKAEVKHDKLHISTHDVGPVDRQQSATPHQQSLPNAYSRDSANGDLLSSTPVSEPRRIKAFAKLEFDDGQFYMNTYSVELGRDRRSAKRVKRETAFLTRRPSSLSDGHLPKVFAADASATRSQVSDSGGIVARQDLDAASSGQQGWKNNPSKSTSSSTPLHSRKNSAAGYLEVQDDYPPITVQSAADNAFSAPPDIASLLPSPHECPFIPIQPPVGARHNAISRQHARISYNSEKQIFELNVIGRNGAFHNGDWRAPGEVQALEDRSVIQIAGVQIRFRLPELDSHGPNKGSEDSVSGRMSFQFENGLGESITMRDSSDESDQDAYYQAAASLAFERHFGDYDEGDEDEDADEDAEDDSNAEDDDSDEDDEASDKAELFSEGSNEPIPSVELTSKRASAANKNSTRPNRAIKKTMKLRLALSDDQHKNASALPRRRGRPKSQPMLEEDRAKGRKVTKHMKLQAQRRAEQAARQRSRALHGGRPDVSATSQAHINERAGEDVTPQLKELYPNLPSGIVVPPRRRGPGRPPKDGIMSKREKALLIRQAKEAEKARRMGLPTSIITPVLPKALDRKRHARRKSAELVNHKEDEDTKPEITIAVVEEAHDVVEAARSISPEMKESDYTLEQLQRPNANYVILIHEAITSAEAKEMNLQQIYHAIEKKYPFYRFKVTTTGWQSSVRHNLQQNGAFMKIRREGKGYVWGINPDVSIEKEKRKRVTPPPTTSVSRSSYHCYSATHLHSHGQGTTPAYYGLAATHPHARYPALQQQQQTNHQSSPHPQQAQQSQPSLKGNAIPTPTPTNIRTYSSPYASPYAPLQSGTSSQSPAPLAKHQQQVHPLAPPPLPSTYRQVPHSPKSAYPGYSGQPTPPPSGSSVESSTTQAQNQATSSAAAAAADNAVLFQRLKQNQGPTSPLGNSTDLSNPHGRHSTGARKPTNPGTLASPGEDSVTKSDVHLYGLPSETVATLLADFRKRFLGANEQSARSESIIDPIIRRFTQPMETQSPPGENELVIIRIIHGMLRDMRQGRSGGLLSAIAHTAAPASLSSVMNEERQSAAIDEKETIVVAGRAAPLSDQETPGTQLSQRNREQLTNVRQSPARERNQTAAQVAAAADAATSGESGPSAESKGQEHTSAEQSKEEADRPAARPVRETRSRWRSNSGAGNGPPGITGFSDKLPTVEVDDGTVPAVSPKELDGRDQDQNADPGQDQDQEKDEEQDQDQRRATRTSKKRTATFSPRIHSISIGGGGLKRRKDYMETRSSMAAAAAKGTAMSNSSQEMSTKRRRGRPRS